MVVNDWLPYLSALVAIIGVFITIETRQEKRAKKLMEDIFHAVDTKINEYANRVQSEKIAALEKENERLKEYARDKK